MDFTFKYGGRYAQQLLRGWGVERAANTVYWKDPETHLVVACDRIKHSDQAEEWALKFINCGSEPTPILQDVWAMVLRVPGNGWRDTAWLHQLHGSLSTEDDWLPFTTEMKPGSLHKFSPAAGRSSGGACPFFNFEYAPGKGVITAIGWTGQWRAEVAWGTKTEIRAGMERMHLSLRPGESIRTPRILQLHWEGNIEDSYNQFRQIMLEHVLPRVDDEVVVAPIAHLTTAAYEWNGTTEADVLSHLDVTAELGFETFWLDAYYMAGGGFPMGIGDYSLPVTNIVAKDRFPNGLGHIGNKVHKAGMEWLVWYCFEAVASGSWLDQEHPEWLLALDDRTHKLLNLGIPEAREYITQYFIQAIREHKMDWLRIDCCPELKPFFHAAETDRDRIGLLEIRWVEGLYRLLDDLLGAYPHLKIDNCDGGGRRIDLEMCKRSTPLWRTDYSTPVQENDGDWDQGAILTQAAIAGLSRYVPFNSCGQFYEEPYWFRSGYNGGIGMLEDCRGEFYRGDRMKLAIEEAKRIRKYWFGNLYLLTEVSLDPAAFHAFQYHRPSENDGAVLIFRRHECPDSRVSCGLREIDEDGRYEIACYYDYVCANQTNVSGVDLLRLDVLVPDCPGSLLIEYRPAG